MTEADPLESGTPNEGSRAWRIFVVPAVVALVGYLALYSADAWLRIRRGPWEATFLVETDGTPAVVVSQAGLSIRDVKIRFEGEQAGTNVSGLPRTVRFDYPSTPVPFGKTAFDDLMYLPGTVVLHCFGHEVQMLPRTLYLNRVGSEWVNGKTFAMEARSKLPTLEPPARLKALKDRAKSAP